MKKLFTVVFLLIGIKLSSQTTIIIEGIDTILTTDKGYNIPHSNPTTLIFRNNKLVPTIAAGYTLQCGTDGPTAFDNNLDGAVILGNKLYSDSNKGSHAIMTGHNIDYQIKFNYIEGIPYGVVAKTLPPMSYATGGISYNIFKYNVTNAIVIKGMKNIPIYNNTFYSNEPPDNIGLIRILPEPETDPVNSASGTKIKNNIFYAQHNPYIFHIPYVVSLTDFECDYNVYWIEDGDHKPKFDIGGITYTWENWQALGYDAHSQVINPNFIDNISFIPATRLEYGTNLGANYNYGLSKNAEWIVGEYPDTIQQKGIWQVGARIYDTFTSIPEYISSVIDEYTPTILVMTYSLSLAYIVPAASCFKIMVNSEVRSVNTVSISWDKVILTLSSPVVYGDIVTVAYTKPAANPLQTPSGEQAASITAQPVSNNCTNVYPAIIVTYPGSGSAFTAPASITITANASDPDGTVTKVEFFIGATKLGEKTSAPWSFAWNNVPAGAYTLTAVATDNLNATTTSSSITITVNLPPQPPVITITNPVSGSTFTAPASITITANASDPDGTVTKVEFFIGATKLGEKTSTPWSYAWNNVPAGAYTLTAVATDNLNATTTSSSITITVNLPPQPPVITITNPVSGSTFTAPASITITANAYDTDGTVTKVEFFNGATKLGEKTSAPWSFAWNNVPAGAYPLTALATDNSDAKTTSSAVSITVNNLPPVINQSPVSTITNPVSGSTFTAPASITITANASDPDGTVTKVEFFNGATKLGEKTSAPWSFAWNNVSAGAYTLTAVATDNLNATTTSSSITITVNLPPQPPVITITNPVSGSTFTAPASITITANAYDTDGTVTKVEFFIGATKLGEKTSTPWSYAWNNVPAGAYTLTAVATDNSDAKTTSPAVSITVNNLPPFINQPPVITITNPVSDSRLTAPANITITANASDPDGTVTKVEFFNVALKLIEITTNPYSYTLNNLTEGTYTFIAIATDNLNATTTSLPFNVIVFPNNNSIEAFIKLFPNPNSGNFSLEINNFLQDERGLISIFDTGGKKVYEGVILMEENIKQLDVSYLNPGLYILMISSKKILATKKLIKN